MGESHFPLDVAMSLHSIISFIKTVLIGLPKLDPDPQGADRGGIGHFIRAALHYRPLLRRFGAAVIVWGILAWLEFRLWPGHRLLQLLAGFGFFRGARFWGRGGVRVFASGV